MYHDGMVYAEVRFAPVYHTTRGLTEVEVVAAVIAGLDRGGHTYGVRWGQIICAMRHMTNSLETAELPIRHRDSGVVSFDLAGGEDGFPPKKHGLTFQAIERANFFVTTHAGEAYGPESIWQALQYCGTHRLGYATRLRDDIELLGWHSQTRPWPNTFSTAAFRWKCASNLYNGACAALDDHPFGVFFRSGFRVCLNTDDRLMSDTSMIQETTLATELFNLSLGELDKLSLNGMKSAFAPHDKRSKLIFDVIKPGFDQAGAQLA
jgi:adenosine deaminase